MFIIKSISNEGEYYLAKGWGNTKKNTKMWLYGSEVCEKYMFKSEQSAKSSLAKLLKVMDEYKTDKFYIVEVDKDGKIIKEKELEVNND